MPSPEKHINFQKRSKRQDREGTKESSDKAHKQKKTAEGHLILSKCQVGTSVARSVAIYQKWLFQYRNIVGEKAFGTSMLANGTPLDPIVIPQAPAANNRLAQATFQADLKYARDKQDKRAEDLAIMRTKIAATTDQAWLTEQLSVNASKLRYDTFDIIGILADHKKWYENVPAGGVGGVKKGVSGKAEVETQYLLFEQASHVSILVHHENFLAILSKYEQVMGTVVPNLERAEKFILSLNKERYKSFQQDFEKDELKQTVHAAQGNADRLAGIGYPDTLANALLVSQLQESVTAKEFKDRSERKKRRKEDKEAKAVREEVGSSYATVRQVKGDKRKKKAQLSIADIRKMDSRVPGEAPADVGWDNCTKCGGPHWNHEHDELGDEWHKSAAKQGVGMNRAAVEGSS